MDSSKNYRIAICPNRQSGGIAIFRVNEPWWFSSRIISNWARGKKFNVCWSLAGS